MRSRTALPLVLAAAGLCLAGAARAQGPEEAPPPAAGVLQVMIPPIWWHWDQRFGRGTGGRAYGQLEPLGVDLTTDSLGTTQLPFLAPAEAALQSVSGVSAFRMDIGRSEVQLSASVRTVPIAISLGLSNRLSIGALVPLVRSRVEAVLRMGADSGYTGPLLGNVGANPAFATPGTYDAFRQQVNDALAALKTQAANGPSALRGQATALLDQYTSLLCGLYGLSAGSDATSACAGVAPSASPFLPLVSSEAGDSIASRLAAAQAAYGQLASLYAGAGVTLPAFTSGFTLPDTAGYVGRSDFESFLTDPAQGVAGDSIGQVLHTRLGDVELGATYAFAERSRWRGLVSAKVRLPTGMVDSENNFIDVGTGLHQLGVEVGTRNDIAFGTGFRLVAAARVGAYKSDELYRRVSPPWFPIAPRSTRALVRRATGSYVGLDLTPTWRVDDAFSIGVRYAFFGQGATRYAYVDAADSARIGMPASVLDEGSATRWMRMGASVTFSTLARFAAGRASLPYSLTVGYQNTFWGRGGLTPKAGLVYITLATYFRLWGESAQRGAW